MKWPRHPLFSKHAVNRFMQRGRPDIRSKRVARLELERCILAVPVRPAGNVETGCCTLVCSDAGYVITVLPRFFRNTSQ